MIKFNCPHCQQTLRVPVSRADTEATCPGCHTQIRVPPAVEPFDDQNQAILAQPIVSPPVVTEPTPVSAETQTVARLLNTDEALLPDTTKTQESEQSRPEDLPESEFRGLDAEEVSEHSDEAASSTEQEHTAPAEESTDPSHKSQNDILKDRRRRVEVSSRVFDDLADQVAEDTATDTKMISHRRAHGQLGVARSNLYLFGVLIVFVAMTSFWLGTMMNPGTRNSVETEVAGADEYVNFEGRVTFRTDDDPEAVDDKALVVLLPKDSLPSEKFVENGIAAGIEIDESLPTVQEIRRLGGDITLSDSEGQFSLKIASGNDYYLLVISARKPSGEQPQDSDLESIGKYFNSPARLLEGKTYRWSQEVVNTHRDIRVYHR